MGEMVRFHEKTTFLPRRTTSVSSHAPSLVQPFAFLSTTPHRRGRSSLIELPVFARRESLFISCLVSRWQALS